MINYFNKVITEHIDAEKVPKLLSTILVILSTYIAFTVPLIFLLEKQNIFDYSLSIGVSGGGSISVDALYAFLAFYCLISFFCLPTLIAFFHHLRQQRAKVSAQKENNPELISEAIQNQRDAIPNSVERHEINKRPLERYFADSFDLETVLHEKFQYFTSYCVVQIGSTIQNKSTYQNWEYEKDVDFFVIVLGSPRQNDTRFRYRFVWEDGYSPVDIFYCDFLYALRCAAGGDPLLHHVASGNCITGNEEIFNAFKRVALSTCIKKNDLENELTENFEKCKNYFRASKNNDKKNVIATVSYNLVCLYLGITALQKQTGIDVLFHEKLLLLSDWKRLMEFCNEEELPLIKEIILNFKNKGKIYSYLELKSKISRLLKEEL